MPVGVIGVVHSIDTLWMNGILDVQQNAVTGAGARRKPYGRIDRNVVALVGVAGLLLAFVMAAAVVQAIQRSGTRIDEYPRARDHFRFLRRQPEP